MLGLEPEVQQEPITPEDIPAEDTQSETKESDITEDIELEPASAACPQPPVHLKRRRLFSYGNMIAKQLKVISNMQRILAAAKNAQCDNIETDEVAAEVDGGNETDQKRKDRTINEKDALYKSAIEADNLCGTTKKDTGLDNSIQDSTKTLKDIKYADVKPSADVDQSNMKSGIEKNKYLANNYSEKSPYYGRIRPDVFCLNPLPPLIIDEPLKEDKKEECFTDQDDEPENQDYCTGQDRGFMSSTDTVVMVDKAQQTLEEFDDNMADFGQKIGERTTDQPVVETWPNRNSSRRDSATLTDVYGIPTRLKKVKLLEKAILKRCNTSFDIFRCHSKETEQDRFQPKPLLRKTSFHRHSTAFETKHLCDRIQQISSLSNKLTFSYDESSDTGSLAPVPPQTPRQAMHDNKVHFLPDGKCEKNVSKSVEDSSCVKKLDLSELSHNIHRESNCIPKTGKSEQYHGSRRMRPLSRAIMAFQSTARDAKIVSGSSEENLCVKNVHVELSGNIHRESSCSPEIKNPKHHNGVRRMRALAQAIMAFQSTAKDAKAASESLEVHSYDKKVNVSETPRNTRRESVNNPEIRKSQSRHGLRRMQPLAKAIVAFQSTARHAKTVSDCTDDSSCVQTGCNEPSDTKGHVSEQTYTPKQTTSDDTCRLQPASFEHKCEKIVSECCEGSSCFNTVNVGELSETINRESVYTPEIRRSQHHHGWRSIRPLARAIMAFQSTARDTNISSSISRDLEDTGIPYIKPNCSHERKPVCVKTIVKSSLLNIELPVEKVFRPKLKRRSTLTRILV